MAQDNNRSGHGNYLDANPRVGRGRVAGTGLPEFESVVFGYSSAEIIAGVAAPIGSFALTTDGAWFGKFGTADANWSRMPRADDAQMLTAALQTQISSPNNNFILTPQDAFAGEVTTTLIAPYSGSFIATLTGAFFSSPLPTGTSTAQAILTQFTVDGVAAGAIGTSGQAGLVAIATPVVFAAKLALVEGEAVGVNWGWGGAQATAVATLQAFRTMALTPCAA